MGCGGGKNKYDSGGQSAATDSAENTKKIAEAKAAKEAKEAKEKQSNEMSKKVEEQKLKVEKMDEKKAAENEAKSALGEADFKELQDLFEKLAGPGNEGRLTKSNYDSNFKANSVACEKFFGTVNMEPDITDVLRSMPNGWGGMYADADIHLGALEKNLGATYEECLGAAVKYKKWGRPYSAAVLLELFHRKSVEGHEFSTFFAKAAGEAVIKITPEAWKELAKDEKWRKEYWQGAKEEEVGAVFSAFSTKDQTLTWLQFLARLAECPNEEVTSMSKKNRDEKVDTSMLSGQTIGR